MSLSTPKKSEARRLTFTPRTSQNPFAGPFPSPYTPSSRRRSGAVSAVDKRQSQLSDDARSISAPDFSKSEEAERYIRGDLNKIMRGLAIDTISTFHKSSAIMPQIESSIEFVNQTVTGLHEQIQISDELLKCSALRTSSRKALQRLNSRLRLECNAWTLLLSAWRDLDTKSDDLCTRRLSPNIIDEAMMSRIPGYSKLQRIVEWLERIADDELEREGGVKLKPLDDPAYRWEYTASRVANDEPVSMDFPLQSEYKLDNVERKAEARLSREVFRLIRAGRLSEAEEICRHVRQPWRAAVLGGGKRASQFAGNGIKGQARRVWRKAAMAVARSTDVAILPHERAVCAALSGVLEPLLAVAEDYEDEAWARISVLLDHLADQALNGDTGGELGVDDSTILQAFMECQDSGKGVEGVNTELLHGLRTLQAFLALGGDLKPGHMQELFQQLARIAEIALQHKAEWLSRFVAQVCLFYKFSGTVDRMDQETVIFDTFDYSVQSYARLIIDFSLEEEEQAVKQRTILKPQALVYTTASYFLAELKNSRKTIETFVLLLAASLRQDYRHEKMESTGRSITGADFDDRRTLCLASAGQCFATEVLQQLVICAVDVIWDEHLPPTINLGTVVSSQGKEKVSEKDQLVVRAIQFLTFPAFSNVIESLERVTKAARRFFLVKKHESAKYAILWFPRDILQHVRGELCKQALREFSSWIAYYDALEKHQEWNVFQSSNRPLPLPSHVRQAARAPPGQVNYAEQSSAKVQLHDYEESMKEFEAVCAKKRTSAVEALKAASFFEKGWMQDEHYNSDAHQMTDLSDYEAERQAELRSIRNFAIPQLTMLLHQVFHDSGLYSEAMELANVIAAEEFQLYKSFGKVETRAFLAKIAKSAIAVADYTVKSQDLKRPYEGTFFEELQG